MAQVRMINAVIGQMPKILRVAPYCRVSTNSANQLNSYATQIRVYKRMVEQRKEWQLVEVFADKWLSGTKAKNRPNFQRMMKDC